MDQQAELFVERLRSLLEHEEVGSTVLPLAGPPQKSLIVRFLLPMADTGADAQTDVVWSGFTPELDLLHLYAEVIPNPGEEGADALRAAAAAWNEICPMGFFNVSSRGSFVHRYTYPVPAGIGGEALAKEAMSLLHVLSGLLSRYYPDAARLAFRSADA